MEYIQSFVTLLQTYPITIIVSLVAFILCCSYLYFYKPKYLVLVRSKNFARLLGKYIPGWGRPRLLMFGAAIAIGGAIALALGAIALIVWATQEISSLLNEIFP